MNGGLHRWLTLALLGAALSLAGCQGGSGGGGPSDGGTSVGLEVALPYRLISGGGGTGGLSAALRGLSADDVVRGHLLAINVETLEAQTFEWSVYLDETTLEVVSNKTIILDPGTYDFVLVLINGDNHYAGRAFVEEVVDGENTIDMTIRPVIGDVITDARVVAELADFRFEYDPDELSGFLEPRLGISVDGGPEQIFAVNRATGLSEHMLLNLEPGTYHFELRFYDGETQRGKSLDAQETVLVAPGVDVAMDLVALHGEVEFALDEAGGDATFAFSIPAEVVNEAGGPGELESLLTVVGDETGLREALLSVTPDGSDYRAEATLPGFQFEAVTLSLAFSDLGDDPVELLGSCVTGATLSSSPGAAVCDLVLRRRAAISGSLLATVGVNVFSELWEPVAGAVVYVDGDPVGVTGSGAFGSPGYLKVFVTAGPHDLRAETATRFGEASIDPAPLQQINVDILLDQDLPPTAFVIDFDDLARDDRPLDYYAGGLSQDGVGPGPDLGVSFGGTATVCTVATCALSETASFESLLYASGGDAIVINVPAGFATGFSGFYASGSTLFVEVYGALDGGGPLLASDSVPETLSVTLDYDTIFPFGVGFPGTAYSVVIHDGGGNYGVDSLNFGTVSPVP